MIQIALIFLLGFLAASFLVLLVAPAIWRRAVLLTRRRLEAALPLTVAEIRADKDAVRAEYAMIARRLEMTVKSLQEKIIAQSLAIERAQDKERNATRSFKAAETLCLGLEEREKERMLELASAMAEAEKLSTELGRYENLVTEQAAELKSLEAMYDEASFAASSRQIELVAHEARADRMSDEIVSLKERHRQTQKQLRDQNLQISEQERALVEEKRRAAALDVKNSKLLAALTDVEERLQRRERDLQQSTGKQKTGKAEDAAGLVLLRESIKDLAAEMVNLTAQVEGPDSEIHQLLVETPSATSARKLKSQSLAERIRTLQKQATAKPPVKGRV